MINIPKYTVIHHSGGLLHDPLASTQWHTVEMINTDHKNRWNFKSQLGWYVGYHFVIAADGKVTQTRNIDEEGAHCKGHNLESIGICLIGNFTKGVDTPTQPQIDSLTSLLLKFHQIPLYNIVPHRALGQTDCPGTGIADDWARNLVNNKISIMISMLSKMMDILRKLRPNFGSILQQECEIDSRDYH